MSWIIAKLRGNLSKEGQTLQRMLQEGEFYQAFTLANSIAHSTGTEFGVEISFNFPAGKPIPRDVDKICDSNIGITVKKGQKTFTRVTLTDVERRATRIADAVRFEATEHGYEGFHAITPEGRMTVLPGVIYIWLPIDRRVEDFLDWLFLNAYGLQPPSD